MHVNKIIFYFFILFVSIQGIQCKNDTGSFSEKNKNKSIYIDEFRLTYFRQILAKSYNHSKSVQEIIDLDHSGFTEQILTTNDYSLIDSLTTADNEKMKIDSTFGNQRAEGAQGKRQLAFILNRLDGKWIDSVAEERYKISGFN
jgi:hypothetical protein